MSRFKRFQSAQPGVTFGVLASSVLLLNACGSSTTATSSAKFGAPSVGEIVDAAAPKGLTGSTSSSAGRLSRNFNFSTSIAEECSTYTSSSASSHLLDNFLSFMKCATFRENSNFAGPTYYRYWVDRLDQTLASIDERFSGATNAPACLEASAISKAFEFRVDHGNAGSSPETVSYDMKFNCYEEDASSGYKMAFGKDAKYYYIANFTSQSASDSKILVLSRASVDGNNADLWFIGTSNQSGPSVPSWAGGKTAVVNRVIANKSTGAFTYSIAEIPLGMAQQSNFIRSNGSVFYFKAQTADGSSVRDVVDGSTTEFCRNAETLAESSSATACSDAGLNTVPSDFGLSTIPRSSGTEFFTGLKADIETVYSTDFNALGIKKTTEQSL